MKCARCGNQWRLVPDGVVEETIEADAPEHNPVAEAPHEPADEAPVAAAHDEDEDEQQPFQYARRYEREAADETDAAIPAWPARRETLGAAISSLSEPPAEADEDVAPEEEADAEDDTRWHGYGDSAESDEAPDEAPADEADDEPRIPAFASRFDAALHGHVEPEDEAEDEPAAPVHVAAPAAADEDAGLSWAQRMSRPWRDITAAIPPEPEPDTADVDTETSIREALRAALEQPEPPAEPRVRSTFNWDTYGAKEVPGDEAGTDASDIEPDQDYPPFRIPGHDPHAEQAEDEEPPFRLSGAAARRPVYDEERDEDEDDAAPRVDSAFEHDIEDVFRSAPLPKKPIEPSRGKQRHDEPLTNFDSIYDDQAMRVPGDIAAGADGYDADTAALQAELESNTDLTEYAPARSGGLAVAAGWAMFLSIISGLALGAVSFRQEIMTALPGTTSLYRAVGFSVASAGVDFADVTYRWTTAEGKPMIEVKGQVINVTNHTVTVPRVLINVRDANSSDSVKATASVPTDTLAPRESAPFTLEFLSPPKNISQIELEFDQNR